MPEGQAPTKATLRAAALARRRALAPVARAAASALISERALAVLAARWPRSVGAYRAFGGEVDPAGIVAVCFARGTVVGLPRMVDAKTMTFLRTRPGDPLSADAFGIPAPSPDAGVLDPEALIVPVTAFDRSGMRIGKGVGAYDRAIDAFSRRRHHPLLVGIAFSVQEVAAIPAEGHDVRLDWIVTENEALEFNPAR
jgi:5-formyltetrahydrofolate cyclo-ligase